MNPFIVMNARNFDRVSKVYATKAEAKAEADYLRTVFGKDWRVYEQDGNCLLSDHEVE